MWVIFRNWRHQLWFAWKLIYRARRSQYTTYSAVSIWGGPIYLKQKICDAGWQQNVFHVPGNVVPDTLIAFFKTAIEGGNVEQVIFSVDGVYRVRRARWCDLGYKDAPTTDKDPRITYPGRAV